MQAKVSSQQELVNCVSNQAVARLLRSHQTQNHQFNQEYKSSSSRNGFRHELFPSYSWIYQIMHSKAINQHYISSSSIINPSKHEYITNPCMNHARASLRGNGSMHHCILATGSSPVSYGQQQQHTHTDA
jgi:hypothetical protein